MSEISHSDELVTKQDLSNFYQGILPYLGGMPDVLANKFSKSDLYSTDEKIVGTWIDGKPLYQKTIVDTLPTVTTEGTFVSKFVSIGASVDAVQIVSSFVKIGATNSAGESIYFSNNLAQCFKVGFVLNGATTNPNTIALNVNSVGWGGQQAIITIQYTKVGDSAVSIGSDTDYSTTEKIVGTWIDGRPLYQKTVVVNSPASAGVDTIVASFGATVQPREMVGLLDNTIPLNYNGTSDWYVKTRIEPSLSNGVVTAINIRMIVAGYTNRVTRITVRYTKTTD